MTLTDLLPATPGPDAFFDAFAGWSKRRGLALYPHQEEALIEIVSGAKLESDNGTAIGFTPPIVDAGEALAKLVASLSNISSVL